jgi:hypothetical protein
MSTKIYSVEDGYNRYMFDELEDANELYIHLAKQRIIEYVKKYDNDYGYLDLQLWITVYDKNSAYPNEYQMPSNLYTLLTKIGDFEKVFKDITKDNLQEKLMGIRLKTKAYKNRT